MTNYWFYGTPISFIDTLQFRNEFCGESDQYYRTEKIELHSLLVSHFQLHQFSLPTRGQTVFSVLLFIMNPSTLLGVSLPVK